MAIDLILTFGPLRGYRPFHGCRVYGWAFLGATRAGLSPLGAVVLAVSTSPTGAARTPVPALTPATSARRCQNPGRHPRSRHDPGSVGDGVRRSTLRQSAKSTKVLTWAPVGPRTAPD